MSNVFTVTIKYINPNIQLIETPQCSVNTIYGTRKIHIAKKWISDVICMKFYFFKK